MKNSPLFLTNCLVLLFSLFPARPSHAQVISVELMAGSALNLPTPLSIRQAGYPDLNFSAQYDTKPFGPYTPYYAWRVCLWDKDQAWEAEQVHHRLFLTNPPPEVQNFSIHFGYNYFFLGHAWKHDDFIFHLDIGPIITNPENTVRGQELDTTGTGLFDAGYDFSGMGMNASASKNIYFAKNGFITLEVAVIAGWAWAVPVSNGSADVPTIGIHGHLGPGLSF